MKTLHGLVRTAAVFVLASASCFALVAVSIAQQPAQDPVDSPAAGGNEIVARVNQEPVFARQVERHIRRALGERPIDEAAKQALRAEALEQIVNRRLILQHLASTRQGASKADVDLALSRVEKQLALQDVTLVDYLKRAAMTEDDLRITLAWQIGWRRYLDRHLTDENLEKHYQRHQRDFDGTKLHVAHILIKVEPRDDRAALLAATQRTEKIKAEIASGKTSFADAAKAHSQTPTADRGGDIGLIERREPMPESFSRAAFALDEGEVSQPVASAAGVHLIKCLKVHPGDKSWREAADELIPAVTQYLFTWLAGRQRENARIEIIRLPPADNAPPAE